MEMEKQYYVISPEIWMKISHILSKNPQQWTLEQIHTNENNVIEQFLQTFHSIDEDVTNALKKRLHAIKQISFDICQKNAFQQKQHCGNF
jgi:hypothetical protein